MLVLELHFPLKYFFPSKKKMKKYVLFRTKGAGKGGCLQPVGTNSLRCYHRATVLHGQIIDYGLLVKMVDFFLYP